MLISFIFVGKNLINKDYKYLKKRLIKLLIPLWSWAIIYYLVYSLTYFLHITDNKPTIYNLLWQCFTGHSLNTVFWFHFDLIVITILFYLIYKYLNKDNGNFVLIVLSIILWIIQYNGLNNYLFGSLRWELSYPLGRLSEMIPYACIGTLLSQYDYLDLINTHKKLTCIISLLVYLLIRYVFNINTPSGFGYSGIYDILLSIVTINIFALLPIKHTKLAKIISSYSMGVYSLHLMIGTLLPIFISRYNLNIFIGDLKYCVLVYVICYVISFLISRIKPLRILVE